MFNQDVSCSEAYLYADVRNIIADDDALQTGLLPALREYNLAQFTVADVPGTEHQVIRSA
jgi:capping protein alpha